MKRNMDLIRQLLLEVEASDRPLDFSRPYPDPGGFDERLSHVELLLEAGLVLGTTFQPGNSAEILSITVIRPTWVGFEFLEATRNDTIWKKVKQTLGEKGLGLGFHVLQELALSAVRVTAGLQ